MEPEPANIKEQLPPKELVKKSTRSFVANLSDRKALPNPVSRRAEFETSLPATLMSTLQTSDIDKFTSSHAGLNRGENTPTNHDSTVPLTRGLNRCFSTPQDHHTLFPAHAGASRRPAGAAAFWDYCVRCYLACYLRPKRIAAKKHNSLISLARREGFEPTTPRFVGRG